MAGSAEGIIRQTRMRAGFWAFRFKRLSILIFVLCAQTGFGQEGASRNLTGKVSDRHEPLRGAVVQMENESTNAVVSYVTDKTGQYSFKRLGADTDYRVSATYRGHRSAIKELSRFDRKKAKVINFRITDQ